MLDRSFESLPLPHGGTLIDRMVDERRSAELRAASYKWPSWDLTSRQLCDLELLLNGAFSPLGGFMTRRDYDAVCLEWRLASGLVWPVPVTLDVPVETADGLSAGAMLGLRDPEGVMLAVLHVEEVWTPDRQAEGRALYGSAPAAASFVQDAQPCCVGGCVEGLRLPTHHDYRGLRQTPRELRDRFRELGWSSVLAFQPEGPMHRADVEATLRAARAHGDALLIHPVSDVTDQSDVTHHGRMRCFTTVMSEYVPGTAMLSLLPFSTRHAGTREALLQAIVRRNCGCDRVMLDGATASTWEPLEPSMQELAIEPVPYPTLVYVADEGRYLANEEISPLADVQRLSETELKKCLDTGREIPAWFTSREVADELRRIHPPRRRQGITIFFTGLSGSGKSTIANALLVKLLEAGDRTATLLDGDLVRKHLSSELGFSKAHRDLNVRRIGYVASEITKSGGIAICSPIAPYHATRLDVRRMIAPLGGFVLVHVATPLAICEQRDRKGHYAKARAGLIPHFTGISDPYEPPTDADVTLDTTSSSAADAVDLILGYLVGHDYVTIPSRAGSVAGL
jgi:sulfate adenylyltransferase